MAKNKQQPKKKRKFYRSGSINRIEFPQYIINAIKKEEQENGSNTK